MRKSHLKKRSHLFPLFPFRCRNADRKVGAPASYETEEEGSRGGAGEGEDSEQEGAWARFVEQPPKPWTAVPTLDLCEKKNKPLSSLSHYHFECSSYI